MSTITPARRLIALTSLLAGLIGGGVGAGGMELLHPTSAVAPPAAAGSNVPALLANVLPGVVSVQAQLASGDQAAGTGMVLTSGGEVLTNAHVVAGASSITITRYGTTRKLPARLVGASRADDLALIQIKGVRNLPTVRLGSSAKTPVGASVVAVGNALGLSAGTPTATEGIISAEGRSVTTNEAGRSVTLNNLFQTDAAINPGNSGGPLFNSAGAVIGVNTAGASAAQGISFAIPIDHVKALLDQLRQGGIHSAPTAYLGITGLRLTPALKDAYGLTPNAGVVVAKVTSGSPAEVAGLVPGDVIIAVDNTPVNDAVELHQLVQAANVGEQIHLKVVRGVTTMSVLVTLGRSSLATG